MRVRLRQHQYVASALLATAGLLYWSRPVAVDMRPWTPLSMPIRLRVGAMETPEFRVGFDTKYRLLIASERKIEFKRLECLLGMAVCDDVPDVIEISWKVLHDGVVAASGSSRDSRGGFYSGQVARVTPRARFSFGIHRYVLPNR